MKTLYIDPKTNDIAFDSHGKLVMVEGAEEEKQSLRILLSTNKGEWFLNEGHGLDYAVIQTKGINKELMINAVQTALMQEKRVKEILSIEVLFDRPNRNLTILYRVRMESGNIIEDQVVV